jgi:hypothetical protein
MGTPIVAKKLGVMTRSVLITKLAAVASRPSGSRPLVPPPLPIAAKDVIAADDTPGTSCAASLICRRVSKMRAGSV